MMSQPIRPVPLGHDPSLVSEQSYLLRTVSGALSTTAYVAHVASASEEDAPEHEYTVHHELAHYQQLVSTPFGFHVALLDWVCAFSVVRALQKTAEHRRKIQIPLVMELVGPHREGLLAQQVALALSVKKQYEPWLVDSGKLDRRKGSQPEEMLTAILEELYLFPGRFSDSTTPIHGQPPHLQALGGQDHPMARCRWRITSRDIMENYATAAVALHPFVRGDSSTFYDRPSRLLHQTRATVPRRYTFLLGELTRIYDEKCLFHGFLAGATQLFDLALFGALVPGMSAYGAKGGEWKNLHPAWRLHAALECIAKDSSICAKLFSEDPVASAAALECISSRLGWGSWSGVSASIDLAPFRELPFVSWMVEEFDVALAVRRKSRNILLPPLLNGYVSLTSAAQSFDLDSGGHFEDHLLRTIEENMPPERLTPPVWLLSGILSTQGSPTAKAIGYASVWYYVSYFVNRMLFHADLRYPAALWPEDDVRQFFGQMTGYEVDDVVAAR